MADKAQKETALEAAAKAVDELYARKRQFRDPIDESMQRIKAFQSAWLHKRADLVADPESISHQVYVRHLGGRLSDSDLTTLRNYRFSAG